MKLIGMLDSPYVRRVAITFEIMQIPFEHRELSVFKDFAEFKAINPAVKAPTLVCEDGEVLMDSSLILQWVDKNYLGRSLWSSDSTIYQKEIHILSLVLAACEKAVQIFYEVNLRPKEYQYQLWLARIIDQLNANLSSLEKIIAQTSQLFANPKSHPNIATAIVWRFVTDSVSDFIKQNNFPGLNNLSEIMEAMPEFLKYPPIGPGVAKGV